MKNKDKVSAYPEEGKTYTVKQYHDQELLQAGLSEVDMKFSKQQFQI